MSLLLVHTSKSRLKDPLATRSQKVCPLATRYPEDMPLKRAPVSVARVYFVVSQPLRLTLLSSQGLADRLTVAARK